MAAVPAQPANEFVEQQLQLIDQLGHLLGICDDGYDYASWMRAAAALSVDQVLVILQVALRVETDKCADALVSGRGCASDSRGRRCG